MILKVLNQLNTNVSEQIDSTEEQSDDSDTDEEESIQEVFELDYLYHATYATYLDEIKKDQCIKAGKHKNWDISNKFIYLARDLDQAASYAETAEDIPDEIAEEDIYVLKIAPNKLDLVKIDIDENQAYSYDDEVNLEDPTTYQSFQYDGDIPFSAVVEVIKY